MRTKLIAGNWKMNGRLRGGQELAKKIIRHVQDNPSVKADIVICPPFQLLGAFAAGALSASAKVALGAQDCAADQDGPHTGDISAAMLKDCGAAYVILGHSERRKDHGESGPLIASKAAQAFGHELMPILCLGENLTVRHNNKTLPEIRRQFLEMFEPLSGGAAAAQPFVLAYEPVWAIGTGQTADPAQIEEVHAYLRELLAETFTSEKAESTRILYGGSVKAVNADEILAIEHVDGALVGGASLKADEFCGIIDATVKNG